MKLFVLSSFIFLASLPTWASDSYLCTADEAGMGLQYVTNLNDLTDMNIKSVEIGFNVESSYQAYCSSEGPMVVTKLGDEILEISGSVSCVDGEKKEIQLKYNLKTKELDNGVRIQSCKPVSQTRPVVTTPKAVALPPVKAGDMQSTNFKGMVTSHIQSCSLMAIDGPTQGVLSTFNNGTLELIVVTLAIDTGDGTQLFTFSGQKRDDKDWISLGDVNFQRGRISTDFKKIEFKSLSRELSGGVCPLTINIEN